MAQPVEIRIPDLGDFADVPVVGILVEPGTRVALDDPLIELESDKATMEVPAPAAGTVGEIRTAIGERVCEGSVFMTLVPDEERVEEPKSDADPDAPAAEPPATPDGAEREPASSDAGPVAAAATLTGIPYASPSVRKYARELGVDLSGVRATGPKGRILREDVQSFVREAARVAAGTAPPTGSASVPAAPGGALAFGITLPAWPDLDHSKFGPVEEVTQTRIQKVSAASLARNWVTIPHVTNFDKADVTDAEAFRKTLNAERAEGARVTLLAFMVKAAVSALKAYPGFNVSFSGGALIAKRYFHIGVAVDTPNGLVVPVIRDCNRKGILEITEEMAALAAKAREGRLSAAEMTGGCFTISSLGGIGGSGFTPIINAPEVAILGAGRSEMQPVWNGAEFVPRLIQPLSLSWDHRAVDGAAAARFLGHIARGLSDPRALAL